MFTIVLNPAMGVVIGISRALDSMFGGKKCPRCQTVVEGVNNQPPSFFDHRKIPCPTGHFFWSCVTIERENHFFCPPHPTDCQQCYGTGCLYCYHPQKGNRCLKCLEYGSHQCPYDNQENPGPNDDKGGPKNDEGGPNTNDDDLTPNCDDCTDGSDNCPNASAH